MDSKRLFICIALWLFLSCALLDDAEGQLQKKRGLIKHLSRRKREMAEGQLQKKRGLIKHLSRRKREMAGFIASQIWVCMLNIFILQRQSLSVIT